MEYARQGKRMKFNARVIKFKEIPKRIDTLDAQGTQYKEKYIEMLENATAGQLDNIL